MGRNILQVLRKILLTYGVPLAVAVLVAIVLQAYVVKQFVIPTPSMATTVNVGDRVFVDRVSYHFSAVDRGDVIVFSGRGPIPLLKRVVGVPGDVLTIRDGVLFVNGTPSPTEYVRREAGRVVPTLPGPDSSSAWSLQRGFRVPAGQYFVMGDNRTDSADSRWWGTVPREDVIGKALVVWWPPGHARGL